jgi:hypothetical protein
MNEVRDDAHKSPERLEREIDETRADLTDTVDALARKFSPGELLDRSLGVVKEHGGEFAVNLRDSIKEKPLAALLTSIGLAWLMAPVSNNRSRSWTSSSGRDYSTSDYSMPDDGSEDWSDETKSTLSRAREKLSDSGHKLKDAVTGARDRLSGARERISDRSSSMSESVSRTTASAREQAAMARERFNSVKEQEPLVLGVIGLAVGALIGGVLPRSETENRLIGEASDATKGEMKTKARDVYGQARDKAEKATEAASQAMADDHQTSPHC